MSTNKYVPIIREIAKYFPGSSIKEGISDCVLSATIYLNETCDYGIRFFQQHNEKRFKISGNWPSANIKDLNGNPIFQSFVPGYGEDESPSITVAVDRDPEAIAKAIKNRLLGNYSIIFQKKLEEKNRFIQHWEDIHRTNEATKEIQNDARVSLNNYGKTVSLEFRSIPPDVAHYLYRAYIERTRNLNE
jgi:hypothetical protein